MFNKIINWIKNILFKNQCKKCGSNRINDGYWTRGWNYYCQQACGDRGLRCWHCGDIQWKQSINEYKNSLPNWCESNDI